ncbi:probable PHOSPHOADENOSINE PHOSPHOSULFATE REDUCTASE [Cephalotrichum gorgonifer]|uniref:phosphoadenylyl-sulfate reductase (thioredoxin) n=1 Tax=Cephalotrichum gorgonifer TaxID=2041049 RepID=A0AAE8MT47_9PEZI|nr:probable PHOSPHOADENOSINE PHOSPHOSULFATE REDUCTASE [Cephalotrichum gorgonifer]
MAIERNSSFSSSASTLPAEESGYVSSASEDNANKAKAAAASPAPHVTLTKPYLDFLNAQLENMGPIEILRFTKILFPKVYQSTAFGLTGLATIDMLSKIQRDWPQSPRIDLVFLDTLYHFQETYDLVERVKERYPELHVHVFKPYGVETVEEFEAMYGEKVYETEAELYDWSAKVEPLHRAYAELGIQAVLTGRRRSQGGARDKIPVIELDEERGVVKINPLVNWSFNQVKDYIKENNVPYNALLDRGYKSVGDWHSTVPVAEGEDERAGRWKGQDKTECGIHNKKSRYAQYLEEMADKAREQDLANRVAMA